MGRIDADLQEYRFDISEHLFRLTTESLRLHSNDTRAYQSLERLVDARAMRPSRLTEHDASTLKEHLAVIPSYGDIRVELRLTPAATRCLEEVIARLSAVLEVDLTTSDALSLLLFDYVVEQKATQVVKALDMGGGWSGGFGRTSNGSHH